MDDVKMSEKPIIDNGHAVNGDVETKIEPNVYIEDENEQTKVDFDNIPYVCKQLLKRFDSLIVCSKCSLLR